MVKDGLSIGGAPKVHHVFPSQVGHLHLGR